MIIEFENCELKIAHIGTPAEILLQQAYEIRDALIAALVNIGRRIVEALEPVFAEMQRRANEMLALWTSMPSAKER